jgi:carbamoyl-phosphate synthase small subunit
MMAYSSPMVQVLSSNPGDPANCSAAVSNIRDLLTTQSVAKVPIPVFGICMGHQLMGLAAGFKSYKLPFGNRGHNQPALNLITKNCLMTSQNHGYALNDTKCPDGWVPYFTNVNDGSNEGIRHVELPFASVQFHPEAMGGPLDTEYLFSEFVEQCAEMKAKRAKEIGYVHVGVAAGQGRGTQSAVYAAGKK